MTETSLVSTQPRALQRSALAEAAATLSDLCDRVDEGAPLDQVMLQAFDDAKLELAYRVDRRIAFDTWVNAARDGARKARDEWAERARLLDNVYERFKANTKVIVEASPDIPWVGSLGKIAVQKSPPSMTLAFGEKYITPDMIKAFAIPDEYLKIEVTYSVDTPALKTDLLAGKEVPWAKIERGTHLRIRK